MRIDNNRCEFHDLIAITISSFIAWLCYFIIGNAFLSFAIFMLLLAFSYCLENSYLEKLELELFDEGLSQIKLDKLVWGIVFANALFIGIGFGFEVGFTIWGRS